MRRRRRRKELRKRSISARLSHLILALSGFFSLTLVLLGLALVGLFLDLNRGLPDVARLANLLGPESTSLAPARFYDRSGERLLLTLSVPGVEARYLPVDETQSDHIAPELVQLTVAAVDPTFYRHPGVTWQSLWSDDLTIAGRLASDYLLAGEGEGLRTRLRIAILSVRLTGRFGRDQVLEWYLNSAAYGHLAYGAEAAAQTYLGKSAADLDLAEAALLVAAQLNPAVDPLQDPEQALDLQSTLLDRQVVSGGITPQDYLQARSQVLDLRTDVPLPASLAPALTDLALAQLYALFPGDQVEHAGLVVYTTLDRGLQEQAESSLLQALSGDGTALAPPAAGSDAASSDLSGSAIVLDPRTGQVLALAGEIDSTGSQAPLQPHPAGTLLSPFIYLAGFTRGLSPASLVWDVPAAGVSSNPASYHGPESIRQALLAGDLAPAWQIVDQVGADSTLELLERTGWSQVHRSDDHSGFPFGGASVALLDAARSFSILAGEGVLAGRAGDGDQATPQLSALLEVRDFSGAALYDGKTVSTQSVVSASLAYLVNSVLSDAGAHEAVTPDLSLDLGRTAAVHSAASADGLNAWTIGYTPQRLVGVWVGAPSLNGDLSAISAGVWTSLAATAVAELPVQTWDEPSGITRVEVCEPSGLLPAEACPQTRTELFLTGSEPVAFDDLHVRLQVNRENGLLATVYTPEELVELRDYLVIPEAYAAWAASAGVELPPTAYDTQPASLVLEDANFTAPASLQAVRGKVSLRGTASLDNFAYYRILLGAGMNPSEWQPLGADGKKPVTGGLLFAWDTGQVEDGIYALRLLVIDRQNRYRQADLLVTVDNTPPEVTLLAPQPGASYAATAGRPLVFRAELLDQTAIDRLAWYLDGVALAVQLQEPFAAVWQPVPGQHTLRLIAYDSAGNSTSTEVTFQVEK